jgi:hypothetical protein
MDFWLQEILLILLFVALFSMLGWPISNIDNRPLQRCKIPENEPIPKQDYKKYGFWTALATSDVKSQCDGSDSISTILESPPRKNHAKGSDWTRKRESLVYYKGPHRNQTISQGEKHFPDDNLDYMDGALYDRSKFQHRFEQRKKGIPTPPPPGCIKAIFEEFCKELQSDIQFDRLSFEFKMDNFVVLESTSGPEKQSRAQGVHVDQVFDGIVAMMSADGKPFKVVVCPGSHHMFGRLQELRKVWNTSIFATTNDKPSVKIHGCDMDEKVRIAFCLP